MSIGTTSNGTSATKQTIVLVDGYGLIFRAYHALPPSLATSSGEQTNAVFGFASMLLDVIDQRKPDYALIALESGRTFRHEEYPDYKGTRAEMPPDLREQIERITQLIQTLGVPIKQRDLYEADDVIGSLARSLIAQGLEVIIITGDSDLLQLVEDGVLVVLPGARRFGEFREFDASAVLDRYGFGPTLIPDYKALVGDTSDNIPGVPGIGDKTARTLISTFGSLEDIVAHADEITPARAKNALAAHTDSAHVSKHLATIVRDLDIDVDLEEARIGRFNRESVAALFRELEFRTLLNRLPASILDRNVNADPADEADGDPAERPEPTRTTVETDEQLQHLLSRIEETKAIAIDVETTDTNPMRASLVGIAIAVTPHESFYIPVGHLTGTQLSLQHVRETLDPIIAHDSVSVYTHHGKYDYHVLTRHGFTLRDITFDTMIAAYLLGDTSIRLKELAFTRLGIEMTEISDLIGTGKNQATMDTVDITWAAPYACGDVESTFGLVTPLRADIEARSQSTLLDDIELPLIPILLEMEQAGIAIDQAELADFSKQLGQRIGEIELEADKLAGRPVRIGSNKQVAALLFEELKLSPGRKTKTGYSVDSDVLESIREEHPVIPLILESRALSKLKSTYADALPLQIHPDTGRVHTSFNQTVAATGRLSSTNPNLQNIPIRTEVGRRIRRAFVADHRAEHRLYDDAVLLAADYSQMELRILAHMSGEQYLIDAFRNGEDIHAATAALVNEIELTEVTPDQRRIAKTVNFGVLYGMQAFGLSRSTGMSRAEAQGFISAYWDRLPKVRAFFDEILERGAERGYVETLSGRRRYLPELTSRNGARRQAAQRVAMNMPIQGTQADIIKMAMIELDRQLKDATHDGRMVLQVHDELVLEVATSDMHEIANLVSTTMEQAFELSVPVIAEVRVGQNWEDLAPLDVETTT